MDNIEKQHEEFTFRGSSIESGKKRSPLKVLIYGCNGVGKSTFACKSRNPILFDLEGNVDHIDVPKKRLETFNDISDLLDCLINQDHGFNSIVIDSLDRVCEAINDKLETDYENKKKDLAFGQIYVKASELLRLLLRKMDILRDKKKMNIIFTAHSTVKRCENPLTQVYDKYDLRVNERMSSIIMNWCQCVLFAVNDVYFEQKEDLGFTKKRERVSDIDKRVIYTEGSTAYVAKNVFNLPKKMYFDKDDGWKNFTAHIIDFYSI